MPEKTTPRERRGSRACARVDDHVPDDPREAAQHVVEREEAVGHDHALDRRVRDVALVPERDVLQRGERVRAHEPREAGHLLAAHRVPLVRHGRGALLARAERLLHLAHLGLLQAADLGRELLEARPR